MPRITVIKKLSWLLLGFFGAIVPMDNSKFNPQYTKSLLEILNCYPRTKDYLMVDKMRALIKKGANPYVTTRSTEENTLCAALRLKSSGLLNFLIRVGVNVNHEDCYGNTPLSLACQLGTKHARVLIAAGAKVNQCNRAHEPLLMRAQFIQAGHRFEIISMLLASGADLFLTDATGQTLLHTAVAHQDVNLVEFLFAPSNEVPPGALLKAISDNRGQTPIDIARALNNQKIITLMAGHLDKLK